METSIASQDCLMPLFQCAVDGIEATLRTRLRKSTALRGQEVATSHSTNPRRASKQCGTEQSASRGCMHPDLAPTQHRVAHSRSKQRRIAPHRTAHQSPSQAAPPHPTDRPALRPDTAAILTSRSL